MVRRDAGPVNPHGGRHARRGGLSPVDQGTLDCAATFRTMLALWVAALALLGTAVALVAWGNANRRRGTRAFLGLAGAIAASVALAYVVYAMVVFCEAPPGSACL
jgi:hypothetical protein